MTDSRPDTIYFISDAHIGAPFPDASRWESRCIDFLRCCADRASALYILGDLFDFWIEYPSWIRPDYKPVAEELASLVRRGVPVHYFAGNHDFALGPYMTKALGITVHSGPGDLSLQGKRVHLSHGDGLLHGDMGYRILKRLLRNPLNQALYKLILPRSLGVKLGMFFSRESRKSGEGFMTEERLAEYRNHARDLLEKGSDIVFLAHTHRAELSRWGNKVYCNTGAWMRTFNFATMEGGEVRLWRYADGESVEELPAMERK